MEKIKKGKTVAHCINSFCESDPPKSKKELHEQDKSVFERSKLELDFRTDTTNKLVKAVVNVHKACETDSSGDGKVAFRHLHLYDQNGVYRLSQYQYDFQYDYHSTIGKFSQQTQPSGPQGCKESDFTLFYQSTIFCATGVQFVRFRKGFVCKYKLLTLHPYDIGNETRHLDPIARQRHPKGKDYFVEKNKKT